MLEVNDASYIRWNRLSVGPSAPFGTLRDRGHAYFQDRLSNVYYFQIDYVTESNVLLKMWQFDTYETVYTFYGENAVRQAYTEANVILKAARKQDIESYILKLRENTRKAEQLLND